VVARMGDTSEGIQPSSFGRDVSELSLALREAGFADVEIQTRELTSVLEGGIPQALEVAAATSAASGLRDVPPERQQAIRAAIAQALQPYVKDGAVVLPSIAHLASATRSR